MKFQIKNSPVFQNQAKGGGTSTVVTLFLRELQSPNARGCSVVEDGMSSMSEIDEYRRFASGGGKVRNGDI